MPTRPLLALLILVLSATPTYADVWYVHYAAAEDALADEKWTEAVEELTLALEKRGDSGARVRTYGMRFIAYFPYLKLGIAYYHLDQFEAALQAFETEEQLGAIAASEADRRELARYRSLTLEAQKHAREEEAARIQGIVEESLASAHRLAKEERLGEAIAAVGNALAVAPDDSHALELLERLRSAMAARQREEDLARRAAALEQKGREHLANGQLAEASSLLRQALSLVESKESRSLLAETTRRLRAELEQKEGDERARQITRGLADVSALEAAGQISDALERLQAVLALDPDNREARAQEDRLLASQAEADRDRLRKETIERLLAQSEAALSRSDYGAAMATANRVLALSAENAEARDQLARAYRSVNRQLLGASPRRSVPPAISFVDAREERPDGTLAQIVRRPEFQLTGIVIDDSPVEVACVDSDGRTLEGTKQSRALGDLFLTEFQVASTLTAGLTTLRLVATDADSLSSSSEYAVHYARPFARTPWFYALLVGLVGLIAAVALGERSRRRRRLRKRRFNPYVAGSPVLDAGLFFGRQELIDRILQTLHNNSLLLHGERRIGKTTLQHQLKRRLEELEDPAFDFFAVYVDLQGTPEERFFATLAVEIFEELGSVLDGLEPSMPLHDAYGYRDLVRDLRTILKALRQRSGKNVRLVLLIDEVDELNAYDPRINQKLRSLFMKSFAEDLVAVVSGVEIKREWDREGSPWYNFFEEINVGPIRPEDARELVRRPLHGVLGVDEAAVDRILELTGCRPYPIQKLCIEVVNTAYESHANRITVDDVDAAARTFEEALH